MGVLSSLLNPYPPSRENASFASADTECAGYRLQYPIRLVGKRARRVINVDYCRLREYPLSAVGWQERYVLVLTMIEVMGCGVSLVLVSGGCSGWVVCES